MMSIHGNLLIGGMALKELDGLLDQDNCDRCRGWRGTLTVAQQCGPLLEVGRDYRLELDDGRAGSVVVRRLGKTGDERIELEIEGRSPLQRERS